MIYQLKKSKKAQAFGLFLVLIFIAGMVYAFFVIRDIKGQSAESIGDRQFQLIDLFIDGEKAVSFVEKSAKQSTYQSVYDLAKNGGIRGENECGKINGFNLWSSSEKECFPDKKDIIQGFGFLLNTNINTFLDSYLPLNIPRNNYDVTALSLQGKTQVIGTALENVYVPSKPDKRLPNEGSFYSIKPSFNVGVSYNFDDYDYLTDSARDIKENVLGCEKTDKFLECVKKEVIKLNGEDNKPQFGDPGTFTWGGAGVAWESLGDNKFRFIQLPNDENLGRTELVVEARDNLLYVIEGFTRLGEEEWLVMDGTTKQLKTKEEIRYNPTEDSPGSFLDGSTDYSERGVHYIMDLTQLNTHYGINIPPAKYGVTNDGRGGYIWRYDDECLISTTSSSVVTVSDDKILFTFNEQNTEYGDEWAKRNIGKSIKVGSIFYSHALGAFYKSVELDSDRIKGEKLDDNNKFTGNIDLVDPISYGIEIKSLSIDSGVNDGSRIVRFCVENMDSKVIAYDKGDGLLKSRYPVYNFALYIIDNPPEDLKDVEVVSPYGSDKYLVLKWRMPDDVDIAHYNVYFSDEDFSGNNISTTNHKISTVGGEITPLQILTSGDKYVEIDYFEPKICYGSACQHKIRTLRNESKWRLCDSFSITLSELTGTLLCQEDPKKINEKAESDSKYCSTEKSSEEPRYCYFIMDSGYKKYTHITAVDGNGNEAGVIDKVIEVNLEDRLSPGKVEFSLSQANEGERKSIVVSSITEPIKNIDGSEFSDDLLKYYIFLKKGDCVDEKTKQSVSVPNIMEYSHIINLTYYAATALSSDSQKSLYNVFDESSSSSVQIQSGKYCVAVVAADTNNNPIELRQKSATEQEMVIKPEHKYKYSMTGSANPQEIEIS